MEINNTEISHENIFKVAIKFTNGTKLIAEQRWKHPKGEGWLTDAEPYVAISENAERLQRTIKVSNPKPLIESVEIFVGNKTFFTHINNFAEEYWADRETWGKSNDDK